MVSKACKVPAQPVKSYLRQTSRPHSLLICIVGVFMLHRTSCPHSSGSISLRRGITIGTVRVDAAVLFVSLQTTLLSESNTLLPWT